MAFSCFVVRPFNKRKVRVNGVEVEVDFEDIHLKLIGPAMVKAGLAGNTTQDIAQAGNIREDMFQLLAHADVVIADISLHNANVFYELGARHALRTRRTFMIRFAADEVPFDLKTDRYLSYDRTRPEDAVDALAQGLLATLHDEARVDSPIFNMLPALKAPSVTALMPVPPAFREELNEALTNAEAGRLLLLADEANELPWGGEGQRQVAKALFSLKAWPAALTVLNRVRHRLEDSPEADTLLATVHQRLRDLAASDNALARVLARPELDSRARAEAHALTGSNAKQRWINVWSNMAPAQAAIKALHSPMIDAAQRAYTQGFAADLNHFYSGINAMSMMRIRADIAQAHPELWASGFDDDGAAGCELRRIQTELVDLGGAVNWSLRRELGRQLPGSDDARWALASLAELYLLRNAPPARVVTGYTRALEGAPGFFFDSVERQLAVYRRLGLFTESLDALKDPLAELKATSRQTEGGSAAVAKDPPLRVIVFSGHRVDMPGRAMPRFPAECEELAAHAIDEAITEAIGTIDPQRVLCIAGGSAGGDMLFQEACMRRGLLASLFLAVPETEYINCSVAGAPGWIVRFHAVRRHCAENGTVAVLGESDQLPRWLSKVAGYDLWERNNRWTLLSALAHGADKVRLIVLWDGQAGDGPGGTQHMVRTANAAGAEALHLDTRKLFDAALRKALGGIKTGDPAAQASASGLASASRSP